VAVSVYVDASILVALFTTDAFTPRADAFVRSRVTIVNVSDFAAAEFASAVARYVRIGELTAEGARDAFSIFDAWTARETEQVRMTTADIAGAAAFLRRLNLALRTGDAINIAIAQRIGADLLTFDNQMAASARALGINVIVA
jgi:predicted nucleic acid-binding protein